MMQDELASFAQSWGSRAFCESAHYDMAAERMTRSSDIFRRFKADSLMRAPTVRAAAVPLPTDGAKTRMLRITKAQGRVWTAVMLAYEALQAAATLQTLPQQSPLPTPSSSIEAEVAPVKRVTRSAVLDTGGVPRLLHLGGTGPQWGYLLGLDNTALRELEALLRAATVYRTDFLDCNRTCEYYTLASLHTLVARYNAGAALVGYAHKVAALSVVTASTVERGSANDEPQLWHQDAGMEASFTVCVALTPVTAHDGPMQYERGRSGEVEFSATGPAGTHWMFLQAKLRHRGSPNHSTVPRRVFMVEFDRVV